MRLIELNDGLWVNPRFVAAVKSTVTDSCNVLMSGDNSVTGGFQVDRDCDDVASEINDFLEDEDGV